MTKYQKTNTFGGNFMTTKKGKIKNCERKISVPVSFNFPSTGKFAESKSVRVKVTAKSRYSNEKILEYYCKDWLSVNKTRIKDSTYIKYFNIVYNHILPFLGNTYPEEIDDLAVMKFGNMLLESGSKNHDSLSPKTVKDILLVLNSIIKHIRLFYKRDLPQVNITYPKRPKKDIRVLTAEEQKRLIEYLTTNIDNCKFGVMLAMYTGLRIGEICALKWGEISTENGAIHICSTMQRLQKADPDGQSKTEVFISSPKSDTSDRWIPMTDNVYDLCMAMKAGSPDAYVLTGSSEHFIEPRNLQYRFAKYMKDCRITGATFHTLRHTFATRCVEVGFEIKSLSEILGHSDVKITLNRYVHSSSQLKKENMDKLSTIGF